MANLPSVPRENAVTPQITSRVTPADIARPYDTIGSALDSLGGAISTKAADYQRMVDQAGVAKENDAAQTAALNLEHEANGDAGAFQTSWDAYTQSRLPNVPATQRNTVEQTLLTVGGTTYRRILSNKFAQDRTTAISSIDARNTTLEQTMDDLASAGQTNSDAFKQAQEEWAGHIKEKVGNPAFGYTQEQADLYVGNFTDKLHSDAIAGEVSRAYQTGGLAGAQARANELANDETMGLNPIQRAKAIRAAMADARTLSANEDYSRNQFEALKGQTVSELNAGSLKWDDPSVVRILGESGTFNDPTATLDIQRAQLKSSLNPMSTMSLADQANFLQWWKGWGGPGSIITHEKVGATTSSTGTAAMAAPVGAAIDKAAAQYGLPPNLLRSIAKIESGGDPNATTGNNRGLFQLSPDIMAAHGGGNVYDPNLNAQAAAAEIKQNVDAFAKKFGRQPTPGEIYLMHQQGPAGGPALIAAQPNATAWQVVRQFYGSDAIAKSAIWDNVPGDVKARFPGGVDSVTAGDFTSLWSQKVAAFGGGSATPGGTVGVTLLDALPAVRANTKAALTTAVTQAEAQLTRYPLSAGQMQSLADAARIAGDESLTTRVGDVITKSQALAAGRGTPLADQTAALDTLRAPGVGETALAAEFADTFEKTIQSMQTLAKTDPRAVGIQQGLFKPGPSIDWATNSLAPGYRGGGAALTVGAVLQQRAIEAGVFEHFNKLPANSTSVLRPDEVEALKGAWTNASPDGKLALLGTLVQNLPGDRLMATLGALDATRSGFGTDTTVKADAPGLAIAGALYATDPATGTAIIRGQAALDANPNAGWRNDSGSSGKIAAFYPPTAVMPGSIAAWQASVDAAQAVYADLSARAGDLSGKLDESRMEKAVNMVTGGVLTFNGQKTIAPIPGMTQSQFDDLMAHVTGGGATNILGLPRIGLGLLGGNPGTPDTAFAGAVTKDGTAVTADFVHSKGVLVAVGAGRYAIELGANSNVFAYHNGPNGIDGVFVLDLKQLATQPTQPAAPGSSKPTSSAPGPGPLPSQLDIDHGTGAAAPAAPGEAAPPDAEDSFTPPDGQYADYWMTHTVNPPNAPGFDPSKPTAVRDQFGEWSVTDTNDAKKSWSPQELERLLAQQRIGAASSHMPDIPVAKIQAVISEDVFNALADGGIDAAIAKLNENMAAQGITGRDADQFRAWFTSIYGTDAAAGPQR